MNSAVVTQMNFVATFRSSFGFSWQQPTPVSQSNLFSQIRSAVAEGDVS